MGKRPSHRQQRSYADAERVIITCELESCIHCGSPLEMRKAWHMRKTVQTMNGPLFVAGKGKECQNLACTHEGQRYYATGVWTISLPYSTYGLDVLAYIGWRHEHDHRQLVELQTDLNEKGVEINERNVGKLYRQFLALLGAMSEQTQAELAETDTEHGGLIWAIDALQPEGHGALLYVLYEVLSSRPVAAIQLQGGSEEKLVEWLKPYAELPYSALATLSDGEKGIIAALKSSWPQAPHQRCQLHFLNNLAEPVLKVDSQLRQFMVDDLGGLPAVPDQGQNPSSTQPSPEHSPAPVPQPQPRDPELMAIESQLRMAVRDALHHKSRKPFHWGGLAGYEQMQAIAQALADVTETDAETTYLHAIARQVNRVVEKNRTLVHDLKQAHDQLQRIADSLHYRPAPPPPVDSETWLALEPDGLPSAQKVEQEMDQLLADFQPDFKRQPAQSALLRTWRRTWHSFGPDLLHCYDIPGLPADNLGMEALFGRLRSHQRRINGRKSTRELRSFGHCQVLFLAESQSDLLKQMQQVPLDAYKQQRQRLAEAEKPRRFLHRLHHNPLDTMQCLIAKHCHRRQQLDQAPITTDIHQPEKVPSDLVSSPMQLASLEHKMPAFTHPFMLQSHTLSRQLQPVFP